MAHNQTPQQDIQWPDEATATGVTFDEAFLSAFEMLKLDAPLKNVGQKARDKSKGTKKEPKNKTQNHHHHQLVDGPWKGYDPWKGFLSTSEDGLGNLDDLDDLDDWRDLCGDLGLPRDLPSKTQCRKAVQSVYVNIHQFLEAEKKPEDIKFFDSPRELANWTRKQGRKATLDWITPGTPLRALMHKLNKQ